MDRVLFLSLGCAIVTYSLAHLYRIAAVSLHIVDQPNHRSAHEEVTPTGAGLSFVLVFGLSLILINQSGSVSEAGMIFFDIAPALLLITVIGLVDDVKPLPWLVRAAFHFIAAVWVIFQTSFPSLNVLGIIVETNFVGLVFGVLALVWLLNLYNFMDGIDGIAISEALFALASACFIAYFVAGKNLNQPIVILMGCCAGFLVINWPKARVFMGDGGSGFLGLLLGALALSETLVPIWSWLILLGWFVTDACLTILIRLLRGEKIHEAHDLHAYQHLNRAVGTARTLLIIHLVNLFWFLPLAALAMIAQEWGLILLILAVLPPLVAQFYCGAGQPTPRMMSLKEA